MAVPHFSLTGSQFRLLAELMLSPLPYPPDEETALTRGLTLEQLQTEVPALQWMELITEARDAISATAKGAAVFHRIKQEKAEIRLTEVVAFADALEAKSGANIDYHRIPVALRKLTQGDYSLEEAVKYLHVAR
ncbi:hypothetical protein [Streptomyces pseudogriseolus]|uniref:hypothetical protein n=1 Tax=Streptomyces pseudogriseolus TaxID=36817 RepID=UPI0016728C25|nr:hypothetical protein GCM10010233_00920 [Streptomyces gancidicus]